MDGLDAAAGPSSVRWVAGDGGSVGGTFFFFFFKKVWVGGNLKFVKKVCAKRGSKSDKWV